MTTRIGVDLTPMRRRSMKGRLASNSDIRAGRLRPASRASDSDARDFSFEAPNSALAHSRLLHAREAPVEEPP